MSDKQIRVYCMYNKENPFSNIHNYDISTSIISNYKHTQYNEFNRGKWSREWKKFPLLPGYVVISHYTQDLLASFLDNLNGYSYLLNEHKQQNNEDNQYHKTNNTYTSGKKMMTIKTVPIPGEFWKHISYSNQYVLFKCTGYNVCRYMSYIMKKMILNPYGLIQCILQTRTMINPTNPVQAMSLSGTHTMEH